MKIASPYRPFVPESNAHRRLGAFDWVGALQMLRVSVRDACHCETFAITDIDTDLPVPSYHYVTSRRRLMLWILEVCLCYLESSDFDQDTVMLSPDLLVYQDLSPWFRPDVDLVLLARLGEKYRERRPLLNEAQWWSHRAKDRLVSFYREALAISDSLPENVVRWGADTAPLRTLVSPLTYDVESRAGLSVQLVDAFSVLGNRRVPKPTGAIIDFKYLSKHHMRTYFERTFGRGVLA